MRTTFCRLCAVAVILIGLSEAFADDDVRKSKNVIYITWDGFRWQEFFGGAQETLIAKDAGVANVEGTKARFWRV